MEKKCCSPWLNVIEMIKGGQRDDGECFQLMLGNWLRRNNQTGNLPRTRGSLMFLLMLTVGKRQKHY